MISTVNEIYTEVLVLGGGVGGYRAAIAAHKAGAKVALAYLGRGASPYITGFNVPLGHGDSSDSPEIYFDDMVRGGGELNDQCLVARLAHETTAAYADLCALGVSFARTVDGTKVLLRHLSGNTQARSVYVLAGTGRAMLEALVRQARTVGITERSAEKVIGLIYDGSGVAGALLWKPHTTMLTLVRACAVVVVMGGLGQLYGDSTYPVDIVGDGCALAFEAGATLIDLEFMQFEPVVTLWPISCRGMEMPTAMLGDGAQLRNAAGERFMLNYNPPHAERQIEKARMALCIQQEIDAGRGLPKGGIWFDATQISKEKLEGYASHCARLRAAGLDPAIEPVIVAPAAHSAMGGIFIDACGWSGIPGLYAAGESTGGVHGASRIAGNGCSDSLVMGAVAGRHAARAARTAKHASKIRIETALEPLRLWYGTGTNNPISLQKTIRYILMKHAGIWRSSMTLHAGIAKLKEVLVQLHCMRASTLAGVLTLLETSRMARSAGMVMAAALARTESRGAHQRTDFPCSDDNWLKHLSFQRDRDSGTIPFITPIH